VCDVTMHTCTAHAAGSASTCGACVSSRQCGTGQTCVLQRFTPPPAGTTMDVGYFCLPNAGATCTAATQPYVDHEMLAEVGTGNTVAVCGLRSTTCPAYGRYDTTDCTLDSDCSTSSTLNDGLCRMGSPDTASGRACTTRCLGPSDCRSGAGCSTGVPPNYCCFGASCT
jgi:hypothetical protein